MKKFMGWAVCLFLAGGASVWSCALDDRPLDVPSDGDAQGAAGSAARENGTGEIIDPGVQGQENVGCNGEEPCVDMLVSANASDVTCPGCLVQGECVAAGELNPDNPCQVCVPTLDAAAWSSNEGAPCDDNSFCTIEDVCVAGACVGSERECDDGIDCNGVAVCLEDQDACSPNENQCDNGALCDVQSGDCVATCEGCVVDGVCLPAGMAATQNPCLVCDPDRSATSLSAAEGQPCGASATECSAQDTCNAEGQCEPNHLESGTPCGVAVANDCDAADTCDGNGQCVVRRADNGTACEDGLFCTTGDQCQGSACVGGGPRTCAANERCDEEAGRCVCAGCSINGACVAAGVLNPANACQICDPTRGASSYSANVGANCGAAATACSAQDTCNAQAQCAPNHLPVGTACGAPGGDQCDIGDSCDGSGQCVQRVAQNGDPCDDGQFCTNGDTCQGGLCRSGAARNCGANETCDEGTDQCRCTGCLVNGTCFGTGALNPGNACQICSPTQNPSGFVGNTGANCGSGPSACSAQDTCSAAGVCQPNHLASGVGCNGGLCDGAGTCQALVNPFTCANADPPATVEPFFLFTPDEQSGIYPSGEPPAAVGGTIRNGRYVPTQVDVYGTAVAPVFGVNELTFEFRDGFVQIAYIGYILGVEPAGNIVDARSVGTATAVGTSLLFDLDECDPDSGCFVGTGVTCEVPASVSYSATANSLVVIQPAPDGSTVVTTYSRQ